MGGHRHRGFKYILIYIIQGVTLRLKPYDGIKFLDVTLKLKPVSVLLPLELVANFSKGRVLGMRLFRRYLAKKGPLGAFLGEACRNLPLNRNLFGPGDPPRNPGQSVPC